MHSEAATKLIDSLNLDRPDRSGATWDGWPEYMPGIRDGQWDGVKTSGRHFDRDQFEGFLSAGFTDFRDGSRWRGDRPGPLESNALKAAAVELEQQGLLGA
jgi:hypothetical protein